MQEWPNWEAAEKADWLLALKREPVIAPLAVQPRVGVQLIDKAALELDLGRSAIYERLKRYRQRSQTSSLHQFARIAFAEWIGTSKHFKTRR